MRLSSHHVCLPNLAVKECVFSSGPIRSGSNLETGVQPTLYTRYHFYVQGKILFPGIVGMYVCVRIRVCMAEHLVPGIYRYIVSVKWHSWVHSFGYFEILPNHQRVSTWYKILGLMIRGSGNTCRTEIFWAESEGKTRVRRIQSSSESITINSTADRIKCFDVYFFFFFLSAHPIYYLRSFFSLSPSNS